MSAHPEKLIKHLVETYDVNDFFTNEYFSLISCYYHTSEMQFPIGMHSHTFYEVNIIASGNGFHYIEEQCVSVDVGDVFVIPPSVKHGYFTDNNEFKIFHILIHPSFVERYKSELESLAGFTTLFETEPLIREYTNEKRFLSLSIDQFAKVQQYIDELEKFEKSNYPGIEVRKIATVLYLISYFSELIYDFHKSIIDKSKTTTEPAIIIKAMNYLKTNYKEKISSTKLEEITNMSRSTLLRQFNKFCNCTPQQYLTKIRIEKAEYMLKNTEKSVTEVSMECGFYDSSHFSRTFFLAFGLTPSDYRKKNRNSRV